MDKLLIIDDEADIQRSFRRLLEGPELEVHTASSGEEALEILPRLQPDVVIMDVRMAGITGFETLRRIREADARLPVIMMTAYATTQTAIEAMKLGAFDYVVKPFDIPKLKELIAGALRAARQMRAVVSFKPLQESDDYERIVGSSDPMKTVFKLIGQLAASDATVLITGESGTGKELVALEIHRHSRRSQQPFVAINCAAIPEGLLESELFGHEKGAFTGAAQQRIGKFEQSDRATLFLDEIGDMPLATQTKILRVLQSSTFERVGGNETVTVDVRVIAATSKPLEQAVAARTFREDLFYRLNVVRVPLPALRERSEDIHLLVHYFLYRFGKEAGRVPKAIVHDAIRALESHHWPGNVRELQNALRRASVVAMGNTILPRDLPPEVLGAATLAAESPETGATKSSPPVTGADPDGLSDFSALAQTLFRWARRQRDLKVLPAVERELVIEALKETQGNQVQAAKLLGITRATLRKRIEKFGIRKDLVIQ